MEGAKPDLADCIQLIVEEFQRLNAEIERLKQELAASKLKWQTGKPPKDGWYWIKFSGGTDLVHHRYGTNCFNNDGGDYWRIYPDNKWAGPIEPPEE